MKLSQQRPCPDVQDSIKLDRIQPWQRNSLRFHSSWAPICGVSEMADAQEHCLEVVSTQCLSNKLGVLGMVPGGGSTKVGRS